jgi:GDP-fucose transporter C1
MLPFTITVSAIHTHVRPRLKVIFAALLVTSGFLISAAPSLYLESISTPQLSRESVKGIMYGCLSSLVLAIHAVLNKTAITYVDNSVVTLAYWANLFMTVTMVPCLILHGELGVLQARFVSVNADWTTFAIGCAVTGVFGFLLGIASSLSIKVTSPITHMFSSVCILFISRSVDLLTSSRRREALFKQFLA